MELWAPKRMDEMFLGPRKNARIRCKTLVYSADALLLLLSIQNQVVGVTEGWAEEGVYRGVGLAEIAILRRKKKKTTQDI